MPQIALRPFMAAVIGPDGHSVKHFPGRKRLHAAAPRSRRNNARDHPEASRFQPG